MIDDQIRPQPPFAYGLVQVIAPSLIEHRRRAEAAERRAAVEVFRGLAEACCGTTRALEDFAKALRRYNTAGIRYGQPWQAVAKPPYRKEMF